MRALPLPASMYKKSEIIIFFCWTAQILLLGKKNNIFKRHGNLLNSILTKLDADKKSGVLSKGFTSKAEPKFDKSSSGTLPKCF